MFFGLPLGYVCVCLCVCDDDDVRVIRDPFHSAQQPPAQMGVLTPRGRLDVVFTVLFTQLSHSGNQESTQCAAGCVCLCACVCIEVEMSLGFNPMCSRKSSERQESSELAAFSSSGRSGCITAVLSVGGSIVSTNTAAQRGFTVKGNDRHDTRHLL